MVRRSWVAAGAIVAGWIAAVMLVDPRADVPLIDDWLYAMSVEQLLAGKGLHLTAWTSTVPLVQIWWGTLVALAGGFSHTTLRVSTLLVATAGLLAYFALLRALDLDERRSALGSVTLAVYPVWFVLSFSFMTDVPFVAVTLASLCALASGLRRGRALPIVAGLCLAAAAFLIRPVAIAIPAALLMSSLRHARRGAPWIAGGALVTLIVMAATAFVVGRVWPPTGGANGLAYRVASLRYVLRVSPLIYLEALSSMLTHLGLAALPALVATAPRLRRWPWGIFAVLLVVAVVVSFIVPTPVAALRPRATWSLQELGAARPLLQAVAEPTAARAVGAVVAAVIGLLGASCLVVRTVRLVRGGAWASPAWSLVGWYGLISVATCFVLWFFYDRYYLPIVPVAIAVALARPNGTSSRRPDGLAPDRRDGVPTGASSQPERSFRLDARSVAAIALLIGLALLDVTGTRDTLAYARAVDAAVRTLRARGIADHAIDAGYVENGWRLYAHPENLAPGQDRERNVPNLSSVERFPFVVANGPVAGYVVEDSIQVPTWWAQGDRLYVLRRGD